MEVGELISVLRKIKKADPSMLHTEVEIGHGDRAYPITQIARADWKSRPATLVLVTPQPDGSIQDETPEENSNG